MQTALVIQILEVLLDSSSILRAAGVDELLSGSIQGGNPRGVGVDTGLHTLEREEVEGRRRRRWVGMRTLFPNFFGNNGRF